MQFDPESSLHRLAELFLEIVSQGVVYWNFYWAVSAGLLILLWNKRRNRPLKMIVAYGFCLFAVGNLFALFKLQQTLWGLDSSIIKVLKTIRENHEYEHLVFLHDAYGGFSAISPIYLAVFHIIMSFVIVSALMMAPNVSEEDNHEEAKV